MILTRRFGALAARRVFPHITQPEEQTPDLPLAAAEPDRAAEPDPAADASAA